MNLTFESINKMFPFLIILGFFVTMFYINHHDKKHKKALKLKYGEAENSALGNGSPITKLHLFFYYSGAVSIVMSLGYLFSDVSAVTERKKSLIQVIYEIGGNSGLFLLFFALGIFLIVSGYKSKK